jgi:hypothetical protein
LLRTKIEHSDLGIPVTQRKEPPAALVKLWITLLMSNEAKEVKDRASEMLLNAFGDMKAVSVFVEKHQIKI